MAILKPSHTKTRGSTRASSVATGLSVCASRFTSSTSCSALREVRHGRDSGDDVAWRQADDKSVGVAENDRVVDLEVKR